MQTIKLEIEDSFYEDMLNKGINIQEEFYKMIDKITYNKENNIANSIKEGLKEAEAYDPHNKSFMSADDFLKELKSGN